MSKILEQRIEALEALAGITPEPDCPEGYRELVEKDVLIAGDMYLYGNGFHPTVHIGEEIASLWACQSTKTRYFRKLAAPEHVTIAAPEPQDCPDGCLPFDLAKALAGHPLRARGGWSAEYKCAGPHPTYKHHFKVGSGVFSYSDDGKYMSRHHPFDLFLVAPKPSPREIVEGLRLKLIQRQSELSRDADAWHAMRFRIDGLRGAIEALAEAGY